MDFSQPVSTLFIVGTIGVIFAGVALGIVAVKRVKHVKEDV